MSGLSRDDLDAVATFLRGQGVDVAGPLEGSQIAGGRSNLTFRLDDGTSRWVLRMPPRAGRTPSAHDVGREFRVTRALSRAGVPVAPAVALCQDESLLGGPFAVSGFVEGRTVQSRTDLDELDDETATVVISRLLQALAALHRVDHVAHGLEGFGRPDAYAERQLRRWSGQWELVGQYDANISAAAKNLVAGLAVSIPEQRSAGIVHGDYRIDNTLLRFDGSPSVAAIVDWELSTIGDPVADVAMMCAYRLPAFDLIVGSPSAWTSSRLPSLESLASDYEAAGGVELSNWEFHLALAYYKIAVIAAGIDHRFRAGAVGGRGFAEAGQAVPEFLAAGLKTMEVRR
ncbi:phosphotransferase family protein [Nocardioides marmoriginsengisoli]|uniref:Phosphotransferase family protein n=1 Tax=Nocardioides marmoriginsengisoli TaxID=661483 RepID=A0A3N0CHA2_9ACTN|nr:phosphotransferase family protein [Nocardioides marmoriginsengisoli]RNL62824.1 phosphotransferase family protein [Nocardioides marmoriginsengisoli]